MFRRLFNLGRITNKTRKAPALPTHNRKAHAVTGKNVYATPINSNTQGRHDTRTQHYPGMYRPRQQAHFQPNATHYIDRYGERLEINPPPYRKRPEDDSMCQQSTGTSTPQVLRAICAKQAQQNAPSTSSSRDSKSKQALRQQTSPATGKHAATRPYGATQDYNMFNYHMSPEEARFALANYDNWGGK
ncbi:hypothetical protein PNOK_0698800 [Pyrrhoderma noxium]|uniref:Uncharacterized protein n=1 Tax=Pyrrhoderma noxium TaxID=2282107 RepID=A0A286UBL7_9AGAM|nr:hypothetical protein PNOK_0698800 [Pyrrhoderma noxium]